MKRIAKETVTKRMWRGKGVSEGIAIGKVCVYENELGKVSKHFRKHKIDVEKELIRYKKAVQETEKQLHESQNELTEKIGNTAKEILKAHISVLQDPLFQETIPKAIKEKGINSEAIIVSEIEKVKEVFSEMDDEYFKDRYFDVEDVGKRLINTLLEKENELCPFIPEEETIIFTKTITPSDTVNFNFQNVHGIVSEIGGETSHAVIVTRSLGIPAVIGVSGVMNHVETGDVVIIDANSGLVFINPQENIINEYKELEKEYNQYLIQLNSITDLPAVTTDGTRIHLLANIAKVPDVGMAKKWGAEGIGLFRTELPFLLSDRMLTEDEQYKIYKTVAEEMEDKEVIIRTLDFGGDKFVPFLNLEKEDNPFLGWRSIRISLEEREIFRVQLRAILRANIHNNIKVMFPMISSYEELKMSLDVFREAKRELHHMNVEFNDTSVGIMIEVPSAALISELLIQKVDFFSIGTNDLIQYMLAVDRNNKKVSSFYQPLNPGVLRIIKHVIDIGEKYDKPVSICGEMASDPLYSLLLLGMGLRFFSMSAPILPKIKEIIRRVSIREMEELMLEIFDSKTPAESRRILKRKYDDILHREIDGIKLMEFKDNLERIETDE